MSASKISSNRLRYPSSKHGLTLLALLVAIAVLGILLAALGQFLKIAGHSSAQLQRGHENAQAAATALGMLQKDCEALVRRADLGVFANAQGQSAFAFYTRRTVANAQRPVGLVRYWHDAQGLQLIREMRGMDFVGEREATELVAWGNIDALPGLEAPDHAAAVATGVLGFAVIARLNDGTWSQDLATAVRAAPARPLLLNAAIAVADASTVRALQSEQAADAKAALLEAFSLPGVLAANQTPEALWREQLDELHDTLRATLGAQWWGEIFIHQCSVVVPAEN